MSHESWVRNLGWVQLGDFSSGLTWVAHAAVVTWHFNRDLGAGCHWASPHTLSFAIQLSSPGFLMWRQGWSKRATVKASRPSEAWALELLQNHFCHIRLVKADLNAESRHGETGSSPDKRSCTKSWPCFSICHAIFST